MYLKHDFVKSITVEGLNWEPQKLGVKQLFRFNVHIDYIIIIDVEGKRYCNLHIETTSVWNAPNHPGQAWRVHCLNPFMGSEPSSRIFWADIIIYTAYTGKLLSISLPIALNTVCNTKDGIFHVSLAILGAYIIVQYWDETYTWKELVLKTRCSEQTFVIIYLAVFWEVTW